MKNSRYFPFERNRYFYGKLLTVRDFESEQTYFNDKRRLGNRLLFGSGVVSGLQVIPVDEQTVSVESGVALDSLGREIVISSPVTLKLGMVEGFTNNEYAKNVYLCIAYDERGKEPVHSVANSTIRSDEISEYNRVLETYRLFIREEAPDPDIFEHLNLFEDTQLLYEDDQVRVLQTVPRYVNPDELFEVTLKVEKTLQTERITFEYELEADSFIPVRGVEEGFVRFQEPGDGQDTVYEMTYTLRAGESPVEDATIAMKPGTARLYIGDRPISVETPHINRLHVIRESVPHRLVEDYYRRSLDEALAPRPESCIYLARISLLQTGPTYVIDKVDPVPFDEYVYNPTLLYRLMDMNRQNSDSRFTVRSEAEQLDPDEKPKLWVDFNQDNSELSFKLGLPRPKKTADDVNTGVIELSLEEAQKSGGFFNRSERSIVSEEIDHGFGPADVFIWAGVEERDDNDKVSDILNMGDRTYYGDESVFKGSEFEPTTDDVSVGTVLYPKRGTFRIGAKWGGRGELDKVRIRWWAIRKDTPGEEQLRQIELEAAAASDTNAGETADRSDNADHDS